MVQKIFHIADLHIRTFQYHELYKIQFEKFLDEIKNHSEKWVKEGIKYDNIRIVIAGDIVHNKINISNEQLILTSWFLKELGKYGKVVIIPGNHDFLENNAQRLDSISPIVELLHDQPIVYYKDMGVYKDSNINWVVYSLYQHNQRPEFEREDGQHHIGLFHGPIEGLSTDLGFMFEDAYSKLNFKDLDVLMCGDIHKRQTFLLPNGSKGIMIGSLIQQNFGEVVKHHGYGVYDVITQKYDFFDIESDQPFMHFGISDITDIEDGKERILNLG